MADQPQHTPAHTLGEAAAAIARAMSSQDNRATSHPMFVVQQRRRLYGFDPAYSDNVVWIDQCNDSVEADAAEHARLEAAYDETGAEPDCWARTAYVDIWEHVTTCFTEDGANAYLKANGHNLESPRVYVESAYRNQEWQDVVRWVQSALPETAIVEAGR